MTVGHVGSMANEYVATGIPFLRSLNIEPYRISLQDLKFISPDFHRRLRKSSLKPGDVVIIRTGKPGVCTVIPDWLTDANCSDLVIVRCGDDLHPRYLAYWVNSLAAHHIGSNLVGAVQQHFNVGSARQMPILLPPRDEQERILSVLATLDDKIELNRRMNETLEGMAQAIFRDWFVDFGPTRRKAAGEADPVAIMGGLTPAPARAAELAALFPAAFGDDGLPVGWAETAISDLVKAQGGSTPSTGDEALWAPAKHYWATPKDLSNMNDLALFDTARQISDAGLAKIPSGLLPVGSVLLSSRAPIGYLAIAQVPVAINQGFIGLAPSAEVGSAYLYCWCKANMDKIVANANGSTFQEISKKNFRPITSALPANRQIIAEFGKVAEPLFARLIAGANERSGSVCLNSL
ncbi:restriction endonuclease subunit S [Sphingobium yanoikuyae]|uniref:restriction endonuclease subunit S n=1 Tax=Sphingobium yanoikuyae TaxID=13690 RepID=UPI0014780CB2|nr:restriction endonuclease subunit S [Sphingobium yanoikuyae]